MKSRLAFVLLATVLSLLAGVAIYQKPSKNLYGDKDNVALPAQERFIVNKSFDLDSDGKEEKLHIESYLGLPGEERTKIYLNREIKPILVLHGFLDNALTHDIDTSKHKVLELQLASGHSINSLIYMYRDGELVRIPVSTEKAPYFMGIVSRNSPAFKDIDGDGVLEMIAFYRHFPPETERTVEVYKFDGKTFKKHQKYEESMVNPYF